MSDGPFYEDRIEFYRTNLPVDLFTAGNIDLISADTVAGSTIYPVQVIITPISVLGVQTVAPIVTIDNGTTGNNIIAATTLATPALGKAFYLRPTANTLAFVVKPGNSLRLLKSTLGVGAATTFRQRTANVALITTGAAHGFKVGNMVTVAGLTGAPYNGRVKILTVPTTTTFTYASVGADEASTADTGGRVGAFDAKIYTHVFRGFNEPQ